MRSNPTVAFLVLGFILASALLPGSAAEAVSWFNLVLLLACTYETFREVPALVVAAGACTTLVQLRALTGAYFVTPLSMWHAGHALIH